MGPMLEDDWIKLRFELLFLIDLRLHTIMPAGQSIEILIATEVSSTELVDVYDSV